MEKKEFEIRGKLCGKNSKAEDFHAKVELNHYENLGISVTNGEFYINGYVDETVDLSDEREEMLLVSSILQDSKCSPHLKRPIISMDDKSDLEPSFKITEYTNLAGQGHFDF